MTAVVDARGPLSRERMRAIMDDIMTGAMAPEAVSELLTTMANRGETAEEIAGGVDSLRRHAVALPLPDGLNLLDTCGTGGDRQHTINVSTLAALTAASCGATVAKHGNRAASSHCGSADVLSALGLNLNASPARVAGSIQQLGFGFCFAPKFHPAMKAVAPIRKALGIQTIFNLIGPLANPARLTAQLVGVSQPRLLMPMAEALLALGVRHALVVHGTDGLDEVTTTSTTEAIAVRHGRLHPMQLSPEEVGLPRVSLEALRGGTPEDNAALARLILSGITSPSRDLVGFNAGCALFVADRAGTIREGVGMAQRALADGKPLALLDRVVAWSTSPEPA